MDYLEVKDKIKIVLLVSILVISLIFFKNIAAFYESMESQLLSLGYFHGSLVFIGFMVLCVMLTPIPYSQFAVVAGAVFGPWLGLIITLFSATLGAVLAFWIGRKFLHNFFFKKFNKNRIYRKILEDEHHAVLKYIFISRLMPQAPFDIVSYFSGITTIKTYKFALVTLLGVLPLTFVLVFFGNYVESYRVLGISLLIFLGIVYYIYKIIKYKRYYVKGY